MAFAEFRDAVLLLRKDSASAPVLKKAFREMWVSLEHVVIREGSTADPDTILGKRMLALKDVVLVRQNSRAYQVAYGMGDFNFDGFGVIQAAVLSCY